MICICERVKKMKKKPSSNAGKPEDHFGKASGVGPFVPESN